MNATKTRKSESKPPVSVYAVLSLATLLSLPLTAAEQEDTIRMLRNSGRVFADIAKTASPAVVKLETKMSIDTIPSRHFPPFDKEFREDSWPGLDNRFKRNLWPFDRDDLRKHPRKTETRQIKKGAGFLVSQDGYILTNNSLVGRRKMRFRLAEGRYFEQDVESTIRVQLADGREFEPDFIRTDPETDLAVLKIDADNLPCLELGDSQSLQPGEWVISIGHPFGMSQTFNVGLVTAEDITGIGLATYEKFIQTNIPLNPGDSGGPLLTLDGKVVGINTATVGQSFARSIGLAIPSDIAESVYKQLKQTGQVVRGYLGIIMEELTPETAKHIGVEHTNGIIVTQVIEDSPADNAGIKYNDVLVEINSRLITSSNQLRMQVGMLKPGKKVKVVVTRDGKPRELSVTIGSRPQNPNEGGKVKSPAK